MQTGHEEDDQPHHDVHQVPGMGVLGDLVALVVLEGGGGKDARLLLQLRRELRGARVRILDLVVVKVFDEAEDDCDRGRLHADDLDAGGRQAHVLGDVVHHVLLPQLALLAHRVRDIHVKDDLHLCRRRLLQSLDLLVQIEGFAQIVSLDDIDGTPDSDLIFDFAPGLDDADPTTGAPPAAVAFDDRIVFATNYATAQQVDIDVTGATAGDWNDVTITVTPGSITAINLFPFNDNPAKKEGEKADKTSGHQKKKKMKEKELGW